MKTVEFQDGYGQKVVVQLSSSSQVRIYIDGRTVTKSPSEAPVDVSMGLLFPIEETRILIAALQSMLRCLEDE